MAWHGMAGLGLAGLKRSEGCRSEIQIDTDRAYAQAKASTTDRRCLTGVPFMRPHFFLVFSPPTYSSPTSLASAETQPLIAAAAAADRTNWMLVVQCPLIFYPPYSPAPVNRKKDLWWWRFTSSNCYGVRQLIGRKSQRSV